MKIVKNINNNFALAIDNANNSLIISGKGVGFGPVPRDVTDLTCITRSYYDVDEIYVSMINDIPEEIIDISGKIIDFARSIIENSLSSNIIFTLADHINFCIQRYQKNMNIKLPIIYDIQNMFEKEMEVGKYGLELIKRVIKVNLPREEAAYIAMHIINAEEQTAELKTLTDQDIIDDITLIIEREYKIKINKQDFNYSRFATHMQYLLKRSNNNQLLHTDNSDIYKQVKDEFPEADLCIEKINKYFKTNLHITLTDEEKLYLILHINRLCTRETTR